MNYHFPEKFEFNRDFFNRTSLTENSFCIVKEEIFRWLNFNCPEFDQKYFNWVVNTTLKNIDPQYSFGIFYYHWLNEFIREASNVAWNTVHDEGRENKMKEKEYYKEADKMKKDFLEFVKEIFP